MNKIILLIAFLLFISGTLSGCAKHADGTRKIPLVYRVDIQQGNVIEQSMIDKLEPGMSRSKVTFIMGTPLLVDPFHSNRWEYIYSIEPRDGERTQRHIALFFKDDKLTHLEGDITPDYGSATREYDGASNVVITGERKKKGFFGNLFGSDKKKKIDDGKGFFDDWFTSDDETEKELDELAKEVKEQSDDSLLPLPERDAEQIERDFEVLEKTEEQF